MIRLRKWWGKLLFHEKQFQNEVVSPAKKFFSCQLLKWGLLFVWLFPLNIIIRIPVIPQLCCKHFLYRKSYITRFFGKIYLTKPVCKEKQWWILAWHFFISFINYHIHSTVIFCGVAYLLECSSAEAKTSAFHIGIYRSTTGLLLFYKINHRWVLL